MATLAVSVEMPPSGELETSGNGTSPSDAQMDEEMKARQKFLDLVSPLLGELPNRPPHRQGNISRVELLGRGVWSQLNHYLLLVTVDTGETGLGEELAALLPKGAKVSVIGTFESLEVWSKKARPA